MEKDFALSWLKQLFSQQTIYTQVLLFQQEY